MKQTISSLLKKSKNQDWMFVGDANSTHFVFTMYLGMYLNARIVNKTDFSLYHRVTWGTEINKTQFRRCFFPLYDPTDNNHQNLRL